MTRRIASRLAGWQRRSLGVDPVLSADFAQSPQRKANWGNGFSTVGVKDGRLHKILVDNPRRFLAFVPKAT